MKYGLSQETIEKINGVLVRFPQVEKAVLYGSRAKGNYKTGSDIDLTLYGAELTNALCAAVAEALDDLLLPYTVDLSVFDDLDNAKLREHIERVGVVFYERKKGGVGKAGWEVKTIGEVCEVVNGGTPKTGVKEYWDGSFQWITPAEMGKRHSPYVDETERKITANGLKNSSAKLLPPKSVILSSRAPIGHLIINTNLMATNQGCKGLIPSKNLQYKYLYYYLFYSVDLLKSLGAGATFKELSGGKLKEVLIPIPPLPEQERIVAILDEVFAGIAAAATNAKKKLANAREIFEAALTTVFDAKGKEWEVKSLADVCEIASALVDPRDKEYLDMPHVGGANIQSKSGFLFDLKTAREERLISGKFAFDKTMVLYSKIRPYLMKVARPDFQGLCSADIYPLSVKAKQLDRDFLFYLLLSPKFTQYANAGSARAGMPKVNRDHLFAFRCLLPPITEQQSIVTKLDALSAETKHLESIYQQKLAALDELKKAILHQAFSGELTKDVA
jgi:type I restriction enzyme S subunit